MANDNNNDATGRIYLVVPVKYRCTYNRLLTALSDFGIDALKDCDSVCKGNKGQVIKCWNMFQAAIAAYNLGNEREADVLKLVVKGLRNKEIAKMLFITSHTVKAHLSQIYKKLGVTNRTAAAIKAEEIIRHQDLKRP